MVGSLSIWNIGSNYDIPYIYSNSFQNLYCSLCIFIYPSPSFTQSQTPHTQTHIPYTISLILPLFLALCVYLNFLFLHMYHDLKVHLQFVHYSYFFALLLYYDIVTPFLHPTSSSPTLPLLHPPLPSPTKRHCRHHLRFCTSRLATVPRFSPGLLESNLCKVLSVQQSPINDAYPHLIDDAALTLRREFQTVVSLPPPFISLFCPSIFDKIKQETNERKENSASVYIPYS